MFLTILTAASVMTLPTPNHDDIFRVTQRVPLARSGIDFSTELLLFVDPEGEVIECIPSRTEGSQALARRVCSETLGLDVRPATMRDGTPIHGFTSTRVTVRQGRPNRNPDDMTFVDHADMVLTLPSTEFSGMVSTMVEVDETGAIVHCEGQTSLDNPSEEDTAKVCDYLATVPLGTMNGEDATPVAYVRGVKVLVNAPEE